MSELISFPAEAKRIGLFGGSFNPPHLGHLHVSNEAIKRMKLDLVIWFVSPQNPLKDLDVKHTFESRLKFAQEIIGNNTKIIVSDLERRLGSNYTIDLVRYLSEHFSEKQFVWMMGADNLENFEKWRNWREIIDTVAVAIFDRGLHKDQIESSEMNKYSKVLITENVFEELKPKMCYYFPIEKINISSTEIRNKGKNHE